MFMNAQRQKEVNVSVNISGVQLEPNKPHLVPAGLV